MFRLHTLTAQTPDPLVQRAMRLLVLDGICSNLLGVLTTGPFLIAFALYLGASNVVIGVVAAIPPFMQIMQIPAIYIVNRYRSRSRVVLVTSLGGRTAWVSVALLPLLLPEPYRVAGLLAAMIAFFGSNAITNCAWNSWMRDLIPDRIMGAFFAQRLAIATAFGAPVSLAAALGVDYMRRLDPADPMAYMLLFALGGGAGMIGLLVLRLIPEPVLPEQPESGVLETFAEPLHHANYRNLLLFLGWWNFAVNMAAPFFAVYMLRDLGLSMAWVLGLNMLSQIVNVLFFQIWGRLSDRFSNKSVLAVAGFLFIATFALWPFTTLPEPHLLSLPIVVVIHAVAGIGTAGVALCSSNIALKCAPYGRATNFLAVNAFVSGIASTIAPILAGFLADFFATQEIGIDVHWVSRLGGGADVLVSAFNLHGLDFLFVLAFLVGLYAMHRLLAVSEEGEVRERVVLVELYAEVLKLARHASNVAGLRHLTYFPYGLLRRRTGPMDGPPR